MNEQAHNEKEQVDLAHYEIRPDDFECLFDGIEQLREQQLLEEETLKGLRFLTCDVNNLYVFSTELHASTDGIVIEKVAERDGMHVYRIPSSEWGADERIYKGGGAWYELKELEQTAVDATRVKSPKTIKEEEKKDILKVVFVPPSAAFEGVQKGNFDYASSLIAHEAAHIEEMRYRDWPNEGEIAPFPDEEQEKEFARLIEEAGELPSTLIQELLTRVDRATIGELYATLVERESRHLSNTEDRTEYPEYYQKLTGKNVSFADENIKSLLSSSHVKAYVLAHAFEAAFPDYQERMSRMRELVSTLKDAEEERNSR